LFNKSRQDKRQNRPKAGFLVHLKIKEGKVREATESQIKSEDERTAKEAIRQVKLRGKLTTILMQKFDEMQRIGLDPIILYNCATGRFDVISGFLIPSPYSARAN
jgi:hypothetical protein